MFASDSRYIRRYIERVCRSGNLDPERALELYRAHICGEEVDAQRLIVNLEMIANAFSLIFARVNVHGEYGPTRSSTVIAHNSIISDALEYLKQNYLEDLRAADVAAYCHCSLSCLSHLFKSRVGTSLPLYIAKLRVDFAREELVNSRVPIRPSPKRRAFPIRIIFPVSSPSTSALRPASIASAFPEGRLKIPENALFTASRHFAAPDFRMNPRFFRENRRKISLPPRNFPLKTAVRARFDFSKRQSRGHVARILPAQLAENAHLRVGQIRFLLQGIFAKYSRFEA